VWRKDSFSPRAPESKAAEVTVCEYRSLFVQQTVVPGETVGAFGE
jgi:hypothetical protein